MRIAIMQPYLFPYIGYFQLIKAVECFVLYDEAQYMKGGWVNRNRILQDGTPRWWTLPVRRDNYKLPIRERHYERSTRDTDSMLAKFDGAYRRATHFRSTRALLEVGLSRTESRVSRFNEAQLRAFADHLGIATRIVSSSEIEHDRSLSGEARVIEICRRLGASLYLNSIGGQELYSESNFRRAGIELRFISCEVRPYQQFGGSHVAKLSIVDPLVFCGVERVREMLDDYIEVPPP